ncbi:MAG: hypothetical protein JWO60_2694, partial [Frankiales bacterium]|nr:hypothetical protein [Frankiales bacterium]
LLVRGLATSTPEGLRPAADLEALEEALRAPRALRLVTATPDGPPVPLTVLRPSGPGVLVQDVTADGVHLFTEVDGEGAARLLRSALEPPAGGPGQAVVRVLLSGPDVADEVLLLVADGGRVLEGPPDGAGPGRPLDGPALDALAARLLTDLLGRPEGAVRPRCGSG